MHKTSTAQMNHAPTTKQMKSTLNTAQSWNKERPTFTESKDSHRRLQLFAQAFNVIIHLSLYINTSFLLYPFVVFALVDYNITNETTPSREGVERSVGRVRG